MSESTVDVHKRISVYICINKNYIHIYKVDFVDLGFCYVSRVLVKMLVIYHLHHGYLMLVFLKGTCLYTPPACTGYPPAGPSSSLPGVPELGRNGWKLMRCLLWCFLSH